MTRGGGEEEAIGLLNSSLATEQVRARVRVRVRVRVTVRVRVRVRVRVLIGRAPLRRRDAALRSGHRAALSARRLDWG